MAVHRRQRQQEARWDRLKLLRDGFSSTENHRWASVKSLYNLLLKTLENVVRSFSDAGVNSRMIAPSSSSNANHRSQINTVTASVCRFRTKTRFRNQAGANPWLSCQTLSEASEPKEPATEIKKALALPCLNVGRLSSFKMQIPLSSRSPTNRHDTWAVVPAPLRWPVKNVSS